MEQFPFPISVTLIAKPGPLLLELDFKSATELYFKVKDGATLLLEGAKELKNVSMLALGHGLFRSSWKDQDGIMVILVWDLANMKGYVSISLPDSSFYSFNGSLFFAEEGLKAEEITSPDQDNTLEGSFLFDYEVFSLWMNFRGEEQVRIVPQAGSVAGELPFWVSADTILVKPGIYLITYSEEPNKKVVHILDLILGRAYTSIIVSSTRLLHLEASLVSLK